MGLRVNGLGSAFGIRVQDKELRMHLYTLETSK